MKIRIGHVSNSSSSSFISIGEGKDLEVNLPDDTLYVPQTFRGKMCFGQEPEKVTTLGARINFAYIQVYDNQRRFDKELIVKKAEEALGIRDDWLEMLEDVLKEGCGVNYVDFSQIQEECEEYGAYIDHQSSAYEGSNTEIFDSRQNLFDFIFKEDSFIYVDNDSSYEADWY